MRWAFAACLCACGARTELATSSPADASFADAGSVGDVVVADVAVDAEVGVFLAGIGQPRTIAVDDERVYFVLQYPFGGKPGDPTVASCAKSGCNGHPTPLVNTVHSEPDLLALDSTNLYWWESHAVLSCGLSGCNDDPGTLTTAFSDVMGIARANSLFAWTANAFYHGTVNVCSMPGCTTPTVIADGQVAPAWITFDATNVYWTNTVDSAGTIMQCALTGCADSPIHLAGGQNHPTGIAVDATSVYWSEGGILKCAIGGCDDHPTYVFKVGDPNSYGGYGRVIVDSGWVYWHANGVFKCPVSGCVGDPIAVTPPVSVRDFAIDKTDVWYAVENTVSATNQYTGQILKAPK